MWTRTDARDAAEACRLAVEVDKLETGPYNITGSQSVLERDIRDLIAEYYGSDVEIRESQDESLSPLSCDRACQAFGYEPKRVWTESNRYPL